jgi:hypothetical protein
MGVIVWCRGNQPEMTDHPSLFSDSQLRQIRANRFRSREPVAEMSAYALKSWKQRIHNFQSQIQQGTPVQQGSLFDVAPAHTDPDSINPFALPQQNTEFWKGTFADVGVAALYFVLDQTDSLLLYIGETCHSNSRWQGEHDCKRYLQNYVAAHRPHNLEVWVSIGFWCDAPAETKPRQQLEQALIQKWRSPFNKENWRHWGTPFMAGKKKL